MAKPWIHAKSSARKFGGEPKDYLEIHQFLDSSKGSFPSNLHRILTHQSWFIAPNGPLEKCFGVVIKNSDGKEVSVRDIGEQHILEDFGGKFIPTVADYLNNMEMQEWMNNGRGGSVPPSYKKIDDKIKKTTISMEDIAPNPHYPDEPPNWDDGTAVNDFTDGGKEFMID